MTDRTPETLPPRIAPLATLPLFHRIAGRKAVVAGGSQGALWKAELLLAAGAEVLVLAGHDAAAKLFEGLAGPLTVLSRAWAPADLAGAVLALADLSERAEAERFVAAAHAAGAVAGLIDHAELGDVQFGTIVNRSPVVLAISTDGGAPMLGQSIRTRIEAILPRGLSQWAGAAKAWRPRVKQALASFAERRAFWERFVRRAWSDADRTPAETDFASLLAFAPEAAKGSVTLVGAGPGDPDLLTLKAVRALQAATVILYDDLVGPDVLELARREAKRIAVGKKGHGPSCKQSDINDRIVALACAGETVVRLKGGDPTIFGRATEEIAACRAAGIPVSVVPGISAAQGAAAALGISLTERREARRVQFVTGHGADGKLPCDIDWDAIADEGATTVVYMPRRTLAGFVEVAIAHGLDPATPALAIASATLPDQAEVAGTLAGIAALAQTLPAGAPVTVIIGRVARAPASIAQFLSEAA
jgi:uroporphyrin-III C-methyltransferase/precorrin-2 dehydrogenase/sirohydrochlorin ferrochelatase